jgi:hypothetical protein
MRYDVGYSMPPRLNSRVLDQSPQVIAETTGPRLLYTNSWRVDAGHAVHVAQVGTQGWNAERQVTSSVSKTLRCHSTGHQSSHFLFGDTLTTYVALISRVNSLISLQVPPSATRYLSSPMTVRTSSSKSTPANPSLNGSAEPGASSVLTPLPLLVTSVLL